MSDDPWLPVIDQADIEAALQRKKSRDSRLVEQEAEITRLRAELATARREGMETAAKIAESEPELPGPMPAEFEKHSRETLARAACIATKRGIVAAIRAAAGEGKP